MPQQRPPVPAHLDAEGRAASDRIWAQYYKTGTWDPADEAILAAQASRYTQSRLLEGNVGLGLGSDPVGNLIDQSAYLADKNTNALLDNNRFGDLYKGAGMGGVGFDSRQVDATNMQRDAVIQQLHALASGDRSGSAAQTQLADNTRLAAGNVQGLAAARGNFGGGGAAMRAAQQQKQGILASGFDTANALEAQERAGAQALLGQMMAAQQQQDLNAEIQRSKIGLGDLASRQNAQFGAANAGLLAQRQAQDLRNKAIDTQYGVQTQNDALLMDLLKSTSQAGGALAGTYMRIRGDKGE